MKSFFRTAIAAGIVLVALGPALGQAPITIGASPSKFDLEIGAKPVNDALRVFNFGSEPARIDVTVSPWTLDEASEIQLLPPEEQSLDQWMIINPVSFEVAPGSFQTIRFSIRPKVEPTPGEHRAMIFMTQQPAEAPPGRATVRVVGRLGVAVYGYVGEVRRTGRIHEVRVEADSERPHAAFDISSIGTAHVRMKGYYTVWPADLYPGADATGPIEAQGPNPPVTPEGAILLGQLPLTPILPDTRRSLPVQLNPDLPPGNYVLDVQGQLGGQPLDLGVPFSVSEASDEQVVSN